MSWRRKRAAVSLAILWAVMWVIPGLAFGLVRYMSLGARIRESLPPGFLFPYLKGFAYSFALVGAFSGGIFAALLRIAGRNLTFEDLSTSRMAAWGAIAASLLPGALAVSDALSFESVGWSLEDLFFLAFLASLGATCGAATFKLAARAGRGACSEMRGRGLLHR